MIKKYSKEKAKQLWDKEILDLSNCTYYQSFEYASVIEKDNNIDFVYINEGNKKIYGFLKIEDDQIKIPFGPIMSDNITQDDLIEYIFELSKIYDKNIIFSTLGSIGNNIEEKNLKISKNWKFITPIIDTTLPIETIIKNATENRRRIIKKGLINIPSDNIKDGIEYLDDFYKLYQKRMNETSGIVDFSKESLENYLNNINSKLVVCMDKNKIIAGHLIFKFGDTVITRYNCFDSDYYKISPSARIEFELIKQCCEDAKIKNYDMSGLAFGDKIDEKSLGINRYKQSYNPTKILEYSYYKYNK